MRASAWIRTVSAAAFAAFSMVASSAHAQSASEAELAVEQPERAYPPPVARYNLVGAGLLTTGFWYGSAAGLSYAFPDAPGAKDLRIPVAGPWLAIAHNGCAPGEPDCSKVWVAIRTILTAIDGLGQAAGIAIALEGIFLPTQEVTASGAPARPRPGPSPAPATPTEPEGPGLFYVPKPTVVGESGVGVGWGGVF